MSDQLSSDLASLKIDRSENPDRRRPILYVAGILALVAICAAVYFVAVPRLSARIFKTEVALTEIAVVSPAQAAVELTSSGYVVPQRVSQVAAKVPGKVARVAVTQGADVAAGDLLFELEQDDQRAAITSAKSRVAAARARGFTARANLATAKQRAARARRLSEGGVSGAAEAEDLEAQVQAMKATVLAADAEVKAAQAEVERLRVGLDSYRITAPMSGTVLNKPPEVGEFVGPQPAGITTDMGGIELADFTSLAVETDVPEQRLHLIELDGPCEIMLDAFPRRRYRGRTFEITPRVNRAKATVVVKVRFLDEHKGVLPDMSARVSFLGAEVDAEAIKEPPKTIVPGSAISERSGAKVVFVVVGDRVRMTPVTLGAPYGTGFELEKGPAPGTQIVNEPPADLRDGQRIKEGTDG